jgi:hypothetical protein
VFWVFQVKTGIFGKKTGIFQRKTGIFAEKGVNFKYARLVLYKQDTVLSRVLHNREGEVFSMAKPRDERPKYTSDEEEEDVYRSERPEIGLREPHVVTEKEFLVKEVKVPAKQAIPRPEEEIESIKRVTPELVGGLFERVKFLEERIAEDKAAMEERKSLHEAMIKDIEDDIAEKKSIESRLTDMDEKRNFKLDISLLRRDKRNELVRFWKDMFELRAELKELTERYEVESRVMNIFKTLDSDEARKAKEARK